MRYSAVFLDLDGTLVDSIPFLKKIFFEFLQSLGIDPNEEIFQKYNGMSLTEIVSSTIKIHDLREDTKKLHRHYYETLKLFYQREVELFPGVVDFLTLIKEKNMRTALVTSADLNIAKLCIKTTKISPYIDLIINPGLESSPSKPNPFLYLKALKYFNVSPLETIAIEDSQNGVKAAVTAKIATCHIFKDSKEVQYDQETPIYPMRDWKEIFEFFRRDFESL